eukprot:XP_001709939.1 Hypothetical protein GL50803_114474 [Giardia lamblia ATCC 50803]
MNIYRVIFYSMNRGFCGCDGGVQKGSLMAFPCLFDIVRCTSKYLIIDGNK